MNVPVKLGREIATVEADWQFAEQQAIQAFNDNLDPAIAQWFAARQLPMDIWTDWVETEVDGSDIHYTFDISFLFDDPKQAMLFKLAFGGSI